MSGYPKPEPLSSARYVAHRPVIPAPDPRATEIEWWHLGTVLGVVVHDTRPDEEGGQGYGYVAQCLVKGTEAAPTYRPFAWQGRVVSKKLAQKQLHRAMQLEHRRST